MKAIVLCGGLGTRLGTLTRDMPKPMMMVAGRPFLSYVLDQLAAAKVDEIVLAVSYHWQKIEAVIGHQWQGIKLSYSVEDTPLGTGGAIRQAMQQGGMAEALVLNGDTLFQCDVDALLRFARERCADIGMILNAVPDAARFGRVNCDQAGRVIAFQEKGVRAPGLINAGVYYVKASVFDGAPGPAFGFEQEILMKRISRLAIYALPTDAYFIDIGIPEDLARAQHELPALNPLQVQAVASDVGQ